MTIFQLPRLIKNNNGTITEGRIAADIVTYLTPKPIHNEEGEIIGEVPHINKDK